jgi:hypothetical protein
MIVFTPFPSSSIVLLPLSFFSTSVWVKKMMQNFLKARNEEESTNHYRLSKREKSEFISSYFLHSVKYSPFNISYVSIPSSPSLTSGNQWQKQLAKRTPPPRLRRKERVTFFGFFFCFFINSGCVESILEKSYLGKKMD